MFNYKGPVGAASVLTLGLTAIGLCCAVASPQAAEFQGGPDGAGEDWENPANWVSGVPGTGDAVTTDSGTNAIIFGGQDETVLTLSNAGSVSVQQGGSLSVTGGITDNSADGVYFTNAGTIFANMTVGPTGYVSNVGQYQGDLDNSGVVYSENTHGPVGDVLWHGDVTANASSGIITNTHATWQGEIGDNAGQIYNSGGGSWIGAVHSSGGTIQNDSGSAWDGDVFNGSDSNLNNIGDAQWAGAVQSNFGSINNNGGTWVGDVLSNDGTVFNTVGSTWTGNMTNGAVGSLVLGGTVTGFIDNSGTLSVRGPLKGVTTLTNTGNIDMGDNDAGDSLSAENWTGTGSATLEFSPTLGRADRVVLSGIYSAQTDLYIDVIGPDQGRAYGNMSVITAKGGVTGGINPILHLPEDGVISYSLVQSAQGWAIATTLSAAPTHVASAIEMVGRTSAAATRIAADRGDNCGEGAWSRALGGWQAGNIADAAVGVGMGGLQIGYDLTCVTVPGSDARLGLGVTAGTSAGKFSQDFGHGGLVSGAFTQGFAGLYGDLVAGSLRAVLQSQLGVSGVSISDPQAALDRATLTSTRYDLSGTASYALAFGQVSLTPELGFAASNTSSRSDDFADVGSMIVDSGPRLDAHIGATLASRIALPDGATILTPFVSLSLHGDLLAGPGLFTDLAGGSARIAIDGPGPYAAIGIGADLLRPAAPSGEGLGAGLRADFKLGPQIAERSLGGYAQVTF